MELQMFLLILLINLGCVVSELSLRFVIITENHDAELPQAVGRAMKLAEENTPGMTVSDDVIQLDRENDEESYKKLCSAVSKGVSIIVDMSWSPWEAAEELSSSTGIPLVRTLLGSQQLVAGFNSYLESRNATDAAILLESESDVDRTLYELLGRSHVRVWVHAGLTRDTANALKSMRPEPSFFVVVGDTDFVTATYKRVR
ncbi:jg19679 [Pararge aegeria aegeria]|uniref:Jg19679 protein n=1 Tax=Pararge aegeria aegeria TaxID=348720 RepID=A0A8S4S2E3_9NEOP|nr:jg19679 [Pararge aegeria aegeria]